MKGFFKEKKKKMPQTNWLPGCLWRLTEGRVEKEKPWKGPVRNARGWISEETVDVRTMKAEMAGIGAAGAVAVPGVHHRIKGRCNTLFVQRELEINVFG